MQVLYLRNTGKKETFLNPTTSSLTAAILRYAPRAGITAALAPDLPSSCYSHKFELFKLRSFRLHARFFYSNNTITLSAM